MAIFSVFSVHLVAAVVQLEYNSTYKYEEKNSK